MNLTPDMLALAHVVSTMPTGYFVGVPVDAATDLVEDGGDAMCAFLALCVRAFRERIRSVEYVEDLTRHRLLDVWRAVAKRGLCPYPPAVDEPLSRV